MFKLSSSKKADIQISLSWLFMIIIGTFFIYVAYNVIDTYSENEDTKYYIQVKSALSNILSKAGTTIGYEENYIQPIDTFFKDTKVEIICNNGLPLLSLNDKIDDNVDFLKNIPSFMTSLNEGKVSFTYLAVENFRAPFKVTNMMGIVSKKNLIVFDSNSDITEILREKFGDSAYRDSLSFSEMNLNTISASTYNDLVNDGNYQSVMFVSDEGINLNLDLSQIKVEAYHLEVSGSSSDFKSGQLKYTEGDGTESIFSYVDFRDDVFDSKPISMITMAIFSRPSTFDCGHSLVVESTEAIFDYYINKVEFLEEVAKLKQVCSGDLVYGSGSTFDGSFQVKLYVDLKKELIKARDEVKNDKFNNHQTLYSNIEEIQRLSQELSDNSCEMLY